MQYSKPYLTVDQQLALLRSRGLRIDDDLKAKEYLQRIGYYRLSAYGFPFRQSQADVYGNSQTLDEFKAGTSFKNITDLYAFDKALRLVVLHALERIEISLRTEVALTLGSYGPNAHRDQRFLDRDFVNIPPHRNTSNFDDWRAKLDEKSKTSKEEFAVHFRKKYNESHMPIWIAVELLDFGPLSHLLSGMKNQDLMKICRSYNVPTPVVLKGWIKTLSFVRNVCAHHARMWNKPLVNQPPMPRLGALPDFDHVANSPYQSKRMYAALCIMRHLLKTINPRTKWTDRLKREVATFPESQYVSLKTAGFPENWKEQNLWR
jgi:abortive infection bacteriophage resistance protein